MRLRNTTNVLVAVTRHPRLWRTAITQWRRTVPQRWWWRRPFLPLPAGDYMRFRTVTQYGSADHPLLPDDVLNYLQWCRVQNRLSQRRQVG